jgi:type VI protein secretion system component VasK
MFVSILVSLLRVLLTSGWSVALEISWKSAAILAVAWAVSLLLRRAPAALRHAVWVLALGSLLLLPALLVLLPAWGGRPRCPACFQERERASAQQKESSHNSTRDYNQRFDQPFH